MVVSIRLTPEQEQRFRSYAASQGLTISEFMRNASEDVITQAELALIQDQAKREHAAEVEAFKARLESFRQEMRLSRNPQITFEEAERARIERYA